MVYKLTYHIKQAGFIVSLFCFVLLSSCGGDKVIAKVDETKLLESDAEVLMIHLGYNINKKEDWSTFVKIWVENESLKNELIASNPGKAHLVQMRSSVFAGELSKFYLEEDLILKELDTSITEAELKQYFNKNQNEFALQDYLVKALYIKHKNDKEIEDQIKNHYLLKNDKDLSKMNSYAKLYAENFYFDDQQWIYFNDLTKDIPLNKFNRDNIVLNRTKTYFTNGEYTYFLNIIDFKLKDAVPPFDFLKPQIREIILSQRINELREDILPQLINKTKNKHDIQINL